MSEQLNLVVLTVLNDRYVTSVWVMFDLIELYRIARDVHDCVNDGGTRITDTERKRFACVTEIFHFFPVFLNAPPSRFGADIELNRMMHK